MFRVDNDGTTSSSFIPMNSFLREKMHARDLLALGMSHQYDSHHNEQEAERYKDVRPSPPMLLPRINSIIASFSSIKTIIYSDHVLIIG